MPKTIISNSSCLIGLEGISKIEILKELYGEIFVPLAVSLEVEFQLPEWIKVEEVKNLYLVKILLFEVQEGEAEAITLAIEKEGRTIILDDKKARYIAKKLGLNLTGTLGVILRAKEKGVIKSVKDILIELENKNFRVSNELKEKILILASED